MIQYPLKTIPFDNWIYDENDVAVFRLEFSDITGDAVSFEERQVLHKNIVEALNSREKDGVRL